MMAARSPSAHSSRSRSRGRESGIRVNSCKDGDDVMSRSLGFLEPLQGIYGSGKRHLRTSPQRSQYGSTYDLDDDRKDTLSNYRYSNVVVGGGTNADREKEITSLRVRENLSLLPKHDAFSHCNHKSDKYYPDTYFPKYTQDIRDEKYEELLRIVDTNKYLTMTMTMTMTTASSTSPTMMHCYSNSNLYPTQNANESFSPMSNALKVSESRNVQSLNSYRPNTNNHILTRPQQSSYTPSKLEIRHTTVTSTFYDRHLAEKQIERNNHHTFESPSPTSEAIYDQHYHAYDPLRTNAPPTPTFAPIESQQHMPPSGDESYSMNGSQRYMTANGYSMVYPKTCFTTVFTGNDLRQIATPLALHAHATRPTHLESKTSADNANREHNHQQMMT